MENIVNNVAQLCPYPVGCLFEQAKSLFEHIVPKQYHLEAFDNGLSRCMVLNVDWSPIRSVAEFDGTTIRLYANFCQFLWMLNYVSLVMVDCSQIMDGSEVDEEISPQEARRLFNEACEMQGIALHLFVSKADNHSESIAQRGRLYSHANPLNKRNKYTDLASSLTITGIAYLLHHEYAHFIKEHDESTPRNEVEADIHGFEKILSWGATQLPYKNVALTGPMMALAATAFLHPSLTGYTHPDIDDRIEALFTSFYDICNEDVPDCAYQLLIAVLAYWSFACRLELSPIRDYESPKEYICRIRKEFILPIQRKTKIK